MEPALSSQRSPTLTVSETPIRDSSGRRIDYLRLSVTHCCNLRCMYCLNEEKALLWAREEVLEWEQLHTLCRVLTEAGVRKIRLTGGEPLLRTGTVRFLESLRDLPARPELGITTNGTLLEKHAAELKGIGSVRVNVSLDSLKRDSYAAIAGRDLFKEAWLGLEAAAANELPVRINVVVIPGMNDTEIWDFVTLTAERAWTVRFIETMPFDGAGGRVPLADGDAILRLIRRRFSIEPRPGEAPAVQETYRVPGFAGRIGIIRARARTFCRSCSRLRIDAAGRVRTCLYAEPVLDLRGMLRRGAPAGEIVRAVAEAVWNRHADGRAAEASASSRPARSMSGIGG